MFRDYGQKNIFFRNKTFLFFKIESWNFQHLFANKFHETSQFQVIQLIQTIVIHIFSLGCLIELKFCEVSRNSFLNRCWKFQLPILKNKKVLFLKKIIFWSLSLSKQKRFVYWVLTQFSGKVLHFVTFFFWKVRYWSVRTGLENFGGLVLKDLTLLGQLVH